MTTTENPDGPGQDSTDVLAKHASPSTQGVPQPGDVVIHATRNAARHADEDQALVVIGSSDVRMVLDDPNDERREVHLHAVPIGWVKDLYQVPKTAPIPVVVAGAYAELRPGAYRLP